MARMNIKIKLDLQLNRIMQAAERNERKLLNHIGGYIRKTAKRSIKKGSKGSGVSMPGFPPKTWVNTYPDFLRYAYDRNTHSVVIGSLLVGRNPVPVPGIIEKGGLEVVKDPKTKRYFVASYLPRPALRIALKLAINSAIAAALRGYIKP